MDRVCPLLGLQGDRRTAIDGVDSGHRCHADEPPIALDRQQQARVCLTVAHQRCDRYLAHATRNGGMRPGRSGVVDGLVSTRLVLSPDPAWRGIAGRARRASTGPLLAIGAAGVAIGIGGVAVASGVFRDVLDGAGPVASTSSPTPSPRATPIATRSAAPSPSPTPTAAPSTSPSSVPTPEPTPAPTAPPPPPAQQTYVVKQGDTLAAIAQRLGTTVAALQSANGIQDPDEIFIGQVLVIP